MDESQRVSRRFIKLAATFFVGVAVGLAPLLGVANVPGFRALLTLFPLGLRETLIPLSAFLLGLAAFATHAVLITGGLSRRNIKRVLFIGLSVASIAFFTLTILFSTYTVRVPFDGTSSAIFVVGDARLDACGCAKALADSECIQELALDSVAVESCWGSAAIRARNLILTLAYLVVVGALGIVLGGAVVAEEVRKTPPLRRRRRNADPADTSVSNRSRGN